MDNTDLNAQLLQKILLNPQSFKPSIVEEIIEWHSNIQPSISFTKRKISNFLLNPRQRLETTVKYVLEILKKLYEAYLGVIKDNYQTIESLLDNNKIQKEWKNMPIELLEVYSNTFNPTISDQQKNQRFYQLLNAKEYKNCFQFIKITGENKNHIQDLLSKMTTNKEASKAADYIKQLKLNPKDYPLIGERLYKNTARHFLSSNGWQYAQEIFEQHSEALATIIQDLLYKKRQNEALSIFTRHQHLKQYLQKPQSIQIIQKNLNKPLQNFLHKDIFGASNPNKYLSLEQFGINEKSIQWVDDNHPKLQAIMKQILSAKLVGIDTESIVGQTKLEKNPDQSAALIQISTNDKVYLFDGFKSHSQLIRNSILELFSSQTIKIGHSLINDTEPIKKSIRWQKNLIINNLIDIWKLFKKLYPKQKYSNLAFICKVVLGKEVCKEQTLTNWKRRPLRRNQIHYAAMDAFCVIKIYQKFKLDFGEMVEYYSQVDNQEL